MRDNSRILLMRIAGVATSFTSYFQLIDCHPLRLWLVFLSALSVQRFSATNLRPQAAIDSCLWWMSKSMGAISESVEEQCRTIAWRWHRGRHPTIILCTISVVQWIDNEMRQNEPCATCHQCTSVCAHDEFSILRELSFCFCLSDEPKLLCVVRPFICHRRAFPSSD